MAVRRVDNKSIPLLPLAGQSIINPSHTLTRPFYFYLEGQKGKEEEVKPMIDGREAGAQPASRFFFADLPAVVFFIRLFIKNGADQRGFALVCARAFLYSSFCSLYLILQDPGGFGRSAWELHALRVGPDFSHSLCAVRQALCALRRSKWRV